MFRYLGLIGMVGGSVMKATPFETTPVIIYKP
jgi:hypothetical protein